MKFIKTKLEGVWVIKPQIIGDQRGWFAETFREDLFREWVGDINFVQENESYSKYGVVRGVHYQLPPYAQGKLVRVIEGVVLDVAVDLRQGSPTFGDYVALELSAENNHQLFIPRGFGHGYAVLSETARFNYKCDNYYAPDHEGGVRFDDPKINIDWQIPGDKMTLSAKDLSNPALESAPLFKYGDKFY